MEGRWIVETVGPVPSVLAFYNHVMQLSANSPIVAGLDREHYAHLLWHRGTISAAHTPSNTLIWLLTEQHIQGPVSKSWFDDLTLVVLATKRGKASLHLLVGMPSNPSTREE